MKRFSQILFYITIALLLVWQLPWCYNFFTAKPGKSPFVLYSSVISDFTLMGQEGDKGLFRRDLAGNAYTQSEFDSILPMFYSRQLMSDERFPDSLHGIAITPRMVQTENFSFRMSPSEINTPHIALYPLLESMSGRVDLTMPNDVFRITNQGIEFIAIASNSIDTQKSRLFTEAMSKKGFQFPAIEISGNPTNRKEYDEGYVLLDANRKLFHLKQIKGRPYVRAVEVPKEIQLDRLFITEFNNHKTYAFMVDVNNRFYALQSPTYDVVKVAIPAYNPKTDVISIFANMFDWTVRITSPVAETVYALRADDYSLIKSVDMPAHEPTTAETIGKYLLPLRLAFTSATDNYVKPRF